MIIWDTWGRIPSVPCSRWPIGASYCETLAFSVLLLKEVDIKHTELGRAELYAKHSAVNSDQNARLILVVVIRFVMKKFTFMFWRSSSTEKDTVIYPYIDSLFPSLLFSVCEKAALSSYSLQRLQEIRFWFSWSCDTTRRQIIIKPKSFILPNAIIGHQNNSTLLK